MTLKFLLDMGISPKVKNEIKRLGYAAIHTNDINKSTDSDEDIIYYARKNDFIVITLDNDFARLVVLNKIKDICVITVRLNNPSADQQINSIKIFLNQVSIEELTSSLITIDKDRHRIRFI